MDIGRNLGERTKELFSSDCGGYTIKGHKYVARGADRTEIVSWHITAHREQNPVHSFWVSGNEFFDVKCHVRIGEFRSGLSRRDIGSVSDDLELTERTAIKAAIGKWEKQL